MHIESKMGNNKKIEVEGREISILLFEEQDYISLTDMLKAKEGGFFSQTGFATGIR
jgi:hypothetical protein